MFNKIKIGKGEIFRGSLILFVMMNIFNFLNYLFHFSMARLLGPVDYGVLAVLMSIAYVFNVPVEAIQTIVSRYTTKLNVKGEYGKIKYLLVRSIRKIFVFSSLIFIIYIPIAFFVSYFTNINAGLVIFTGFLIFGVFLLPVIWGVLQGRKKFKSLGGSMITESFLKLVISISLVLFGFKVYGAMAGVILGVTLALLLSFSLIKEVRKAEIKKIKIEGIYSYGFPVVTVMFIVILMASLDIIFVKAFFDSDIAGKYAVASMLGKMIFFGTVAISKAMFPLTSEEHDKGNKPREVFKKAFLIVFFLCFVAVIAYWLIPKLIIWILFGKQYLEISNILIFIALAFSFLSLTNLSLIYALSVYKKKISFFLVFVLLEVLVFSLFHSNLLEFCIGFMTINFIMFLASLIFVARG